MASTSLVQRKGLKRRPFLCTPSRLETQELCRARQGIIINTGGAKCEYRGGAKSSCQTQPESVMYETNEDLICSLNQSPSSEVRAYATCIHAQDAQKNSMGAFDVCKEKEPKELEGK